MDQAIVSDFKSLLSVELAKINEACSAEIGAAIAQMAGRGILHSSVAMRAVVKPAAQSIPLFAQVSFNLLLRCMQAHGAIVADDNRDEVTDLLNSEIDREVGHLEHIVSATAPMKMDRMMAGEASKAASEIGRNALLEKQRLATELRLISAANRRAATEGTGQIVQNVFNGAVGLVQTGAGSIAISQPIDARAESALSEAFEKVLQELERLGYAGSLPFDADEVKELVVEGKAEIAKPKPNGARLRAIVSAVGATISYAPKIKAAYDALKWAAAFIHVNLP